MANCNLLLFFSLLVFAQNHTNPSKGLNKKLCWSKNRNHKSQLESESESELNRDNRSWNRNRKGLLELESESELLKRNRTQVWYNVSLADLIALIVGETSHHIKNTKHLSNEMASIRSNKMICSYHIRCVSLHQHPDQRDTGCYQEATRRRHKT